MHPPGEKQWHQMHRLRTQHAQFVHLVGEPGLGLQRADEHAGVQHAQLLGQIAVHAVGPALGAMAHEQHGLARATLGQEIEQRARHQPHILRAAQKRPSQLDALEHARLAQLVHQPLQVAELVAGNDVQGLHGQTLDALCGQTAQHVRR